MRINRMEVNAAIEQLIAGVDAWEEPARVIVSNCNQINKKGLLVVEASMITKSDGESVTGHAPGMGDVTIHDKPQNEHKEFVFGCPRERIGYFKVWKESHDEIGLKHWWKADIGTRAPDDIGAMDYFLGFDKETLEPKYFGAERERLVFNFLGIQLSRLYLEPLYGEADKRNRGWVLR